VRSTLDLVWLAVVTFGPQDGGFSTDERLDVILSPA
jgi:hypothetical protein